jgi:hypothetical protein
MSKLKEIALRKIGRNVVNFQKIEGMLKLLLSQSNFKSPISKITETLNSGFFIREDKGKITK